MVLREREDGSPVYVGDDDFNNPNPQPTEDGLAKSSALARSGYPAPSKYIGVISVGDQLFLERLIGEHTKGLVWFNFSHTPSGIHASVFSREQVMVEWVHWLYENRRQNNSRLNRMLNKQPVDGWRTVVTDSGTKFQRRCSDQDQEAA